ncbi:MAG: hypothetical protein JSU92_08835 [Deltaproteobacteria bacterium]|nr:MAG: hypothetical protein JSU92_08835 [Deltaproteobacteria bacterium]
MKSRLKMYLIVFCIAWATLALELLQTRILSALFFNNVIYLTVTVALMGFGISGVFVSIFSRKLRSPEKLACISIGLFAISSFVCMRIVSYLPVIATHSSTITGLIFGYTLLTIPFIFSGCALGLIFMTHGRDIYRLYFIDLCASALGAIGFAFLLRPLSADALLWLVSGVALGGFILYSFVSNLSIFYIFLLGAIYLRGFLFWGLDLVNDEPIQLKTSTYMKYQAKAHIERSEWTTIAKIDVWSENKDGNKTITQDGDAFTIMPSVKFSRKNLLNQTDPQSVFFAQSLPYIIRPEPDDVLVIGPGGGQEMIIADVFRAKRITGVEVNPAIYDFVRGPYRNFLQWPGWKNVILYNTEGRHFISSTESKYDVISMTGIDTFAALNSGAYVLAENYLYTVEAMEEYLNSLKPDGLMFIARWLFRQPREGLRLANLYMSAADRLGIEHPSQSIMVMYWYFWIDWTVIMAKKEPFTENEIHTIFDRIKDQEDLCAIYIPDVFPEKKQKEIESEAFSHKADFLKTARLAYNELIRSGSAEERSAFEKQYMYNITPVTDDRPFFFEYHKISEIFSPDEIRLSRNRGTIVHYILFFLLGLTGIVSFLAMILPLYIFEREGLKVQGISSLLLFFCSLGTGFMFIELGFIQRLSIYLGHPMHTLAVGLAGILMFTGIGSYRAGHSKSDWMRLLRTGMIGTSCSALIWLIVMKVLIPLTLGSPLWVRVSIVLLSIFPIGLFMGIPFATGLRYLEHKYPRFIPWAWGINGLTSVMGSVLAIILAMRFGFTMVILLGCLVYAFGLVAIVHHLRRGLQVQ